MTTSLNKMNVKAFLIYPDIQNRQYYETAIEENPKMGLLIVSETEIFRLFGEPYRGQVIKNWRNSFEKSLKFSQRFREFYQYSNNIRGGYIRLVHM